MPSPPTSTDVFASETVPTEPSDNRPPRIPVATYRVQLNRHFTLRQAIELVSYLNELGISDLYCSPIGKARPGTLHGYDVVDPRVLNPELGTDGDLAELGERLRSLDMGMLLDVVPNHMCISDSGNEWWQDVLENGPSSIYAHYFDIEWDPPTPQLRNKVLLPVLADQYGKVLENQQMQVFFRDGAFAARYLDTTFPLAPRSWVWILGPARDAMKAKLGADAQPVTELQRILNAISRLPRREETDEARVRERRRRIEILKRRLRELSDTADEFRKALEWEIKDINGRKGEPRSFDRLEALLADQAYRLSYWHVA